MKKEQKEQDVRMSRPHGQGGVNTHAALALRFERIAAVFEAEAVTTEARGRPADAHKQRLLAADARAVAESHRALAGAGPRPAAAAS